MAYKVKIPKSRRPNFKVNRIPIYDPEDDPPLTGYVNNRQASDIEERFARALRKLHVEFMFDYPIYTAVSLPNQDNQIDFLVKKSGLWYAIEIDGEIGHKTWSQKSDDMLRDVFVNEALSRIGVRDIERIPWTKLETQEMADRTAREVLRG